MKRGTAKEALLDAGALQRAMFNSANFSSIATDAKGVIQLFNVGAERMLGYSAAEMVNKRTPADLSDSREMIARAASLSLEFATHIAPGFEALVFKASRGIEDIYELTKIRKDGSRFPAMVSVTALRDAQDTIIGYLLIGTDNTARKQVEEEKRRAEEARLTSEARYRALFDYAPDGIVIADSQSYYLDANGSACRMLGYTRDELIGLHASDIVAEREVQRIGPDLSVINSGSDYHREWQLRRKDGSLFDAEVIATKMPDGNLLGMIRDVTDRKLAEDALRQSEQRFRGFVTASSDAVYRMSPDWSEMRQLHGQNFIVDTAKPSNTWFQEYIHPDDQPRVRTVIDEAIRTKSTFELEHRVRRVDGSLGWTFSRAIPLIDAEGEIVEWFGAASDVTERKVLEQSLQLKNIELEEGSRMKSEFLANMSHELRTPLNSIIGFSEVLKEGLMGEMTEKQRGFVGDIYGSGQHLLSLINDILDLSKVEAGRMELDLEPVLVSVLLSNSLSIVREKAAAHRIRMDMEVVDGLGSTQLDARKVKQIVYNLLSNAVKFTAEGGCVTLRAARVPRARVGRLSGPWKGRSLPLADVAFEEFLEISVTDNGIGIAGDGLERLFTPFNQIDSGLARKFEGTGLGLVMVRLLSELHGGSAAVESAAGEGSRFTVWLPMRAEVTPPRVRAIGASPAPAAGSRVALVVEDDPKSAELIRLHLEAEGFKVLLAASAEEALVLAVQQPVSLITLDILLPSMEGWEFLTRLKMVPELRRTPVVIISIVAEPNKGYALGAAAVMQKPVSRQALYDALLDLGLFPASLGQTLRILVVDDDPKAVELIAVSVKELATTVLRASGGREAIDIARSELPDAIVLDLMMPEVSGFDVVEALKERPDTARIPILIVTAKRILAEDHTRLSGYVAAIMEKAEFDRDHFTAEVRRAMSGRAVVA